MANPKFTAVQQDMLRRAQKVIDDASLNYGEMLQEHIQNLENALVGGDLAAAMKICYRIQTQASTFGWPLATEVAGWFKRLLELQREGGLNSTVNELFLKSFTSILQNDLRKESAAAFTLIGHIEAILKKENIR